MNNTETPPPEPKTNHNLDVAQQALSMANIQADRCLLRRNMKASQNKAYNLPQDDLPECEDDMGVQIGDTDNSQKTTHNHYHNDCPPTNPTEPQPCPPRNKLPWWLLVLLVLPWIVLTLLLIGWLVGNQPSPDPRPLVGWELDIGSGDPILPEPTLLSEPTGTPQ